MEKQTKILISVLCVLIAGASFFAGAIFNEKRGSKSVDRKGAEDTFQAGWDAARKKLEESRGSLPANLEIKSISGVIKKISNESIEVKVSNALDPLADPSLETRMVKISKDTKMYLLKQKDQVQFQKEMEEFQKKNSEKSQELKEGEILSMNEAMPSPMDKTEISIKDLRENDDVVISSNEDIKNKKEFIASEISVMAKIVVPEIKTLPAPSDIPSANNNSSVPISAPNPPSTSVPASPVTTVKPPAVPTSPAVNAPTPPALP